MCNFPTPETNNLYKSLHGLGFDVATSQKKTRLTMFLSVGLLVICIQRLIAYATGTRQPRAPGGAFARATRRHLTSLPVLRVELRKQSLKLSQKSVEITFSKATVPLSKISA